MRAWGAGGHPRRQTCEYEPHKGREGALGFYLARGSRRQSPAPALQNPELGAQLV